MLLAWTLTDRLTANPIAISRLAAIRIEAGRKFVRNIWSSLWMCFKKSRAIDHPGLCIWSDAWNCRSFLSEKNQVGGSLMFEVAFLCANVRGRLGGGVTTRCQSPVKALSNCCHGNWVTSSLDIGKRKWFRGKILELQTGILFHSLSLTLSQE